MRRLPWVRVMISAGALAAAAPAAAWGPEGHTVIARVAVAALDVQAAQDLQWIVTVGVPALNGQIQQTFGMKCQIDAADPWGPVPDFTTDHDQHTNLANWPDCYRQLDASTAGWHFNDIPLGQSPGGPLNAPAQSWCATPQQCVSVALAANLRQLATAGTAPADAARSLAFVVHLLGDLHQPLHEEDNGDLGGNNVLIKPAANSGVKASKLHELWDTPLVAIALGADLDPATTALEAQVDAQAPLRFNAVDDLVAATDGWAEDAHALAQPAYALLHVPVGAGSKSGVKIRKSYVHKESGIVDNQLALAAIRLRAALNVALTWSPPE